MTLVKMSNMHYLHLLKYLGKNATSIYEEKLSNSSTETPSKSMVTTHRQHPNDKIGDSG